MSTNQTQLSETTKQVLFVIVFFTTVALVTYFFFN
jgi:hypothetical protein